MRAPGAVAAAFAEAYDGAPQGLWAAPGRVNLIGEHTDYNDGFVLPLALPYGVVCAASRRDDGQFVVRSAQVQREVLQADPTTIGPGDVRGWAAYAVGVAWAMHEAGHDVPGVELLLDGDVPLGAGLSSSAAVECAVALALDDLAGLALDRTTLAALARRAENEFVGAPTGVMDQMASLHGRAGHALFLDTRSLEIEHVPLDLAAAGLTLLVIDTRAPHRLVDGEYAARRRDCEEAARRLGLKALRDVTPEQVGDETWAQLPDALARRARHVVGENVRVLEVVSALRDGGNPARIGPALTASHESLRDDFEVTVPELDVAVEAALDAGAYGARMTGGGFGGCVIALVEQAVASEMEDAVRKAFAGRGFVEPATFAASPSRGAHRLL